MYTEVTTFYVHSGSMDDLIRHFQDRIVADVTGCRGFVGLLLLTDRQADRALAIELWETDADRLMLRDVRNAWPIPIMPLLADMPSTASYAVSVQVERTEQGSLRQRGI